MKFKTLAIAAVAFVAGAATWSAIESRTTWLSRFQPHTDYRVVNTASVEWLHHQDAHVRYDMKFLYKDPTTHEVAMLVHYPAGEVNPAHIHSHGHGMYVLRGTLVTHRGTYETGSFVWFPPDEVMTHGAPPNEDVVVLFLRHEDMTTEYVQPADH